MPLDRSQLLEQYRSVRRASIDMCEPLAPEEFRIQPMPDVSPPWWNLGHTSWFFVRNVLEAFGGEVLPEDRAFDGVLNSYYVTLGPRWSRPRRGMLSRPTTEDVYRYRNSVDRRVRQLLGGVAEDRLEELAFVLTVGMHHERQHQELFYTEIKSILAQNPPELRRPYCDTACATAVAKCAPEATWVDFEGGLCEFGNVEGGWCWDNELPVHKHYLHPYRLLSRLVTNGEYLEFVEDGGYQRQLLWLDNGWTWVQQEEWTAPMYWELRDGLWWNWTLGGTQPINPAQPVCHVSFYEADAFARWKGEAFEEFRGAHLPTERQWEHAARTVGADLESANLLDCGRLHPAPPLACTPPMQMLGDVWEWTSSYYEPYPGYRPFAGALAEYNGKFMDNQRVLRGGSCVTERDHLRISYRNFWSAPTRFQFTGFRLAQDR
jgi:ergothioneine biosynthesis protein EgtB